MPETIATADRIKSLFDHLGLDRAHVAACMSGDWGEFAVTHADRFCSLTVVSPHLNKGIPETLDAFAAPSLVITGDQGSPAWQAKTLADKFRDGKLAELHGYASPSWADVVADRRDEIATVLGEFHAAAERQHGAPTIVTAQGSGEVAGLHYRIDGQGPALVLLPLSLAPSQWEPLVAHLSQRFCVIRLGGPHLGIVPLLEGRAQSGYGDLTSNVLAQADAAAATSILEVGCGSGAVLRPLVKRLGSDRSLVGADINPYLLSVAQDLAKRDGLSDRIRLEQANAEALPFDDASFDLTFCFTVLEEGDADRMLQELARVTRPGGRVAVLTRANDIDWPINLPVSRELRQKLAALGPATGAGVGARGCADYSLYARVTSVGLTPLKMGPQFAIYRNDERMSDVIRRVVAALPADEAQICRAAIRQGEADGMLFAAEPFHCAVAARSY